MPEWNPSADATIPLAPKDALATARKALVGDKDILPKADPLHYDLRPMDPKAEKQHWYWMLIFKDDGPRSGSGGGVFLYIPVLLDGTMPDISSAPGAPDKPFPVGNPDEQFEIAVQSRDRGEDPAVAMKLFQSVIKSRPSSDLAIRARLRLADLDFTFGSQDLAAKNAEEALAGLRKAAPKPSPRDAQTSVAKAFPALLEKLEKEALYRHSKEELLVAALKGIAAVYGPWGEYLPPPYEGSSMAAPDYGVGLVIGSGGDGLVISHVMRSSPAWLAGVQTGWLVTAVEGKKWAAFAGDSKAAIKEIRGPIGTPVRLTFRLPDATERTLEIVRKISGSDSPAGVFSHHLAPDGSPVWQTEDGIAGAAITSLYSREEHGQQKTDVSADLRAAFTSGPPARAWLLDLRSTSGGHLDQALKVADLFIKEGEIAQQRHPFHTDNYSANPKDDLPTVPMVVLVNGYTAHTAELVAAALQDRKRAHIIGRRTCGHGEVLTFFEAPARALLVIPVAEYLRPGGLRLERRPGATAADEWGVTPDLLIPAGAPLPTATDRQPEGEWQRRWDITPPDRREAALREDIQYQAALTYLREKLAGK